MKVASLVASVIITAFLAIVACAENKGKEKKRIDPKLEQVTLTAHGRVLKPVRIIGQPFIAAGDRLVAIDQTEFRGYATDSEKPVWTVKFPEGVRLEWLTTDERFAYVVAMKLDKKNGSQAPDLPLAVKRLALDKGEWANPLAFGATQANRSEAIIDVLAGRGWTIVLTQIRRVSDDRETNEQLLSYRLTTFKGDETKAAWSKSFESSGELGSPGVYLWAARSPESFGPNVKSLNWLGDDQVLVCNGALDDILSLKKATGDTAWKTERIWEYKRGFIGPSVWQHFIAPAGEFAFDHDDKKPKKDPAKDAAAGSSYIAAGPAIVQGLGQEPRLFIAVAKGPLRYTSYLVESTIYELDVRGRPVAMTPVPRMPLGSRFKVAGDSVVWACGGGAFLKLRSSPTGRGFGMGPGGPDCLCDIDWYRQIPAKKTASWLATDPAGDPTTFAANRAFRVRTGGYVAQPKDQVFRFPIAMIELHEGTESPLLLNVPFDGELAPPKTNYSFSEGPFGAKTYQTSGPYEIAITLLGVLKGRLLVTIGMENWSRTLEFDLADIEPRK